MKPPSPSFFGAFLRMTDPAARPRRTAPPAKNGPADARVDHERIEAAVREILLSVGEDPDR